MTSFIIFVIILFNEQLEKTAKTTKRFMWVILNWLNNKSHTEKAKKSI